MSQGSGSHRKTRESADFEPGHRSVKGKSAVPVPIAFWMKSRRHRLDGRLWKENRTR